MPRADHKFVEVISRFIPGSLPQVKGFLHNLTIDKNTILTNGPFADKLLHNVWPEVNKIIRSEANDLPPGLLKLENKYAKFKDTPKSIYSYKMLLEMYSAYEHELRYPSWSLIPFADYMESSGYENPWLKSSEFTLNLDGLDLSKGAGNPQMGPKKDQLNQALLYADKIEADQKTPSYMFLPGFRTQIEKTRGIWQDPISEYVNEIRAFRSALLKAVDFAKQSKEIRVFYCTPEELHKYLFADSWAYAVVLDAKQFDASVTAWEIDDFLRYLAADYVAIDHVIDHAVRAPLQMPNGVLRRYGGLASGKVFTNLLDGAVNFRDIHTSFDFISRYIGKYFVNGDDIGFLADTIVTEDNVTKASKISARTLEPDKCWYSNDDIWFSKIYMRESYFCKPAYLVLHSCIYRERDPLEGVLGKGYLAIATAQKCEWLKDHPKGERIVKLIKAQDKYPIESLDDSIVKPALEVYRKANSYLEESGQLDQLYKLPEESFYATV